MANPEWRLLDSDLEEAVEAAKRMPNVSVGPVPVGDLVREINRLREMQRGILAERDSWKDTAEKFRAALTEAQDQLEAESGSQAVRGIVADHDRAKFKVGDCTVTIRAADIPEFIAELTDLRTRLDNAMKAFQSEQNYRDQDVARLTRERDDAREAGNLARKQLAALGDINDGHQATIAKLEKEIEERFRTPYGSMHRELQEARRQRDRNAVDRDAHIAKCADLEKQLRLATGSTRWVDPEAFDAVVQSEQRLQGILARVRNVVSD